MATRSSPNGPKELAVTRMRRLQSERRARSGDVMAGILSAYFYTARDRLLEAELDLLIDSFLVAEGVTSSQPSHGVGRLREGRALTVIGGSGTGKSRALDRHFLKRGEFEGYGDPNSDCMLISVIAPSPSTLRLLGLEVLCALGYEVARELKENVVWNLVNHQLELRGIRFLHVDELQHVQQSRNTVEIGKIQDTLKRLMQNPKWPVWLILSGLPSITTMLCGNEDDEDDEGTEQVWRRIRYVVFEDLKLEKDAHLIRQLIKSFGAERAALSINVGERRVYRSPSTRFRLPPRNSN